MSTKTLKDIGEKDCITSITRLLRDDDRLLGGRGHDSAVLDLQLAPNEVLLTNTDRSGMNIAYSLGLAGPECAGDFAVSHAVSDILVSGGDPVSVSIALLAPPDLPLEVLNRFMKGADDAAHRYGAFIAGGDTKHAPKFAAVVTALGKAKRDEVLMRAGAQPGDVLLVTGHLGTMMAGKVAFQSELELSDQERETFSQALIYQNPPYRFSRALAKARLATAAMDNSDGLSGTLHTLCQHSGVGFVLNKQSVPIHPSTQRVAQVLGIDPFQFALASGDWSHCFAVPEHEVDVIKTMAEATQTPVSVIGQFTEAPDVLIQTEEGVFAFPRLENDRFRVGGTAWFKALEGQVNYLGNEQSK